MTLAKTTGHVAIILLTTRVNVYQVSWESCVKVNIQEIILYKLMKLQA